MVVYTECYEGIPERKIQVTDEKRIVKTTTSPNHRWSLSLAALRAFFVSVFLPQGYPDSVSDDYVSYQIWDTVQAFASSMTGALATEAVLRGAGVGDKTASALAASMTWLVKDGLGMLGRIAFTYFRGCELDANPKKWRLVADILNDAAFCLDLLSPAIPSLFLPLVCVSSLFRCVVGVAGGATRTAITQHQARRNNLADVSAKDGSQETLVNVVALLASLILLPAVSGHHTLIWTLFVLFTFIHLFANYRAVRSLSIQSLNKNRTAILIDSFLATSTVPSVVECNRREPLFHSTCGVRNLGCSVHQLLQYSEMVPSAVFQSTQGYLLLMDVHRNHGFICFAEGGEKDVLEAFFRLQCISKGKPFDQATYRTFVALLDREGFDSKTLHLGVQAWTYRKTE